MLQSLQLGAKHLASPQELVGSSRKVPVRQAKLRRGSGHRDRLTLLYLLCRLLSASSPAVGGESAGHVGQHIAHYRQGGHVLAKILEVYLVEGIRFGVMPVEVMRAHSALGKAGHSIADEGPDIRASASAGDLSGADALEQCSNLLEHLDRILVGAGAEPERRLGPAVP